jgi:hypothetical protein
MKRWVLTEMIRTYVHREKVRGHHRRWHMGLAMRVLAAFKQRRKEGLVTRYFKHLQLRRAFKTI